MPLIYSSQPSKNLWVAVWQILESETDLLASEVSEAGKLFGYSQIKNEKRRLQWLCSRLLIEQLYPGAIVGYHSHGKPFLRNGPFLSISHTTGYAAVALSNSEVGIDIQAPDEKLLRVAPRFSSDNDLKTFEELDAAKSFQYIWAIKEAVFKTYGTRLPFKEGIAVTGLSPDLSQCNVRVQRDGSTEDHLVHLKTFSDSVLACVAK